MKKFIFLFASIILTMTNITAQKNIVIDIDSIFDNQVFIISQKWKNSKDTIRLIEYKVNGAVYGDSTAGNFNITVSWKLDTAKALDIREKEIKQAKKLERKKILDDLERFDKAFPDAKKPAQNPQRAATIMIETPPPPKPKKPKGR